MGFLKTIFFLFMFWCVVAAGQSTSSPNMSLPISIIGATSGLNWENNLNASLNILDGHNHTAGQGVQIPPAGLNLNSDLTFQDNNATNLRSTRFYQQGSPIPNSGSDVGELYVSGNELYYNDVTGGHQVQITATGNVNATSSGISSGTATAAFSGATLLVKSSSTSFANTDVQSIVLANSGNLSNQLTLQAPTLSSSYSVTLPTVPGAQNFLAIDSSGNITPYTPTSLGINTANIAANAVTRPKLVAVGQQVSSSSGAYTTTSTSFGNVTNLSVTITTTGRPVMLMVMPDGTANDSFIEINASSTGIARFKLLNGSNTVGISEVGGPSGNGYVQVPAGTLNMIDTSVVGAAGTYTYKLQAAVSTLSSAGTVVVSYCVLAAYEL